MNGVPLILDSAGLDQLAAERPSPRFRALVAEAERLGRDVRVAAVTCAEVCRGAARTRRVEAALARHGSRPTDQPAVDVVPTDLAVARQVGAILHAAGAGSADLVDAHSVALGVAAGGGVIATSDPDDIDRLAAGVPAVRLVPVVV